MKKRYVIPVVIAVIVIAVAAITSHGHNDTKQSKAVTYKGSYIAMGDSVAAGVGLGDYTDSSACDRNNDSYPQLVAKKLGYKLVDVACSGATTHEGLLGQQEVNKLMLPPQLDSLNDQQPKLITITIGANDARWLAVLQQCYTSECGSDEQTLGVAEGISTLQQNLRKVLQQIKSKYPENTPKVAVTDYYSLFPAAPKQGCAELSGIDASELAWLQKAEADTNVAIHNVSTEFSFTVPVQLNFDGHELCSQDSWIQGLNDAKPFHPNEAGHKTISQQILSALSTGGVRR